MVRHALNETVGILHSLKSGDYALDNNAIERQFNDVILGRKNYLFCEGHASAERAASVYSLIGCCKLNNIDSYQYLAELLPRNWKPLEN